MAGRQLFYIYKDVTWKKIFIMLSYNNMYDTPNVTVFVCVGCVFVCGTDIRRDIETSSDRASVCPLSVVGACAILYVYATVTEMNGGRSANQSISVKMFYFFHKKTGDDISIYENSYIHIYAVEDIHTQPRGQNS